MKNALSPPPTNVNIRGSSSVISDVTPAVDMQQQVHPNVRRSERLLSCSRRINTATAATSAASVVSDNLASSSVSSNSTSDNEEDHFNNIIERLNQLDLEDADGGSSDVEGEESEIFDSAYLRAMMERSNEEGGMHVEEISTGDIAFVLAEDGVLEENHTVDLEDKVHKAPDDWIPPDKKEEGDNEPDFEDVDNPGNWSNFIFRPVYKKEGRGKDAKYTYIKHELPTGCTPVPMNSNGKRVVNGWEFFIKDGSQKS